MIIMLIAGCSGLPVANQPAPTYTEAPPRIVTVLVTVVPTSVPTPTMENATPTPAPPPPTPAAPTASPTPGCTMAAQFVADITIPDGTTLAPNTPFVKTWRIKNAGSCDWGRGLTLAFVSGEQLGGPSVIAFPPTVAGASQDISLSLKAPPTAGAFTGKWYLRDPEGERLTAVTVSIVVPATPTPTPPPSVTPKPTLVPTYDGALESFLGEWRVVEDKFGDNITDTQRLFKIQITQAGSALVVAPETWPLSPYSFSTKHEVSAPYQGGREFTIEFDDSARGHVKLKFSINKACNATVNLDYSGFRGKFIFWNVKPHISCT